MNKELTPDQVRNIALDAVDDYLKRSASDTLSFYDLLPDTYSTAWGQAKIILLEYGLVVYRAGDNSLTDLSEDGYVVLQYGGIRKFLAAKSALGMIKAQNEVLQNELLKFQNNNRDLDRDLKTAQAILAQQQSRELRHKKAWGIIGALAGALVSYLVDHFLIK